MKLLRHGFYFSIVTLLISICCFISPVKAEITILDVAWTNGINSQNQPLKRYRNRGKAPKGPLYLWMKIKGNNKIRHKWFRYLGTHPHLDRSQTAKCVKQDTIWYVWTGKQDMQSGWWRVKVIYVNNNPVKCNGMPCSYSIRVKNK